MEIVVTDEMMARWLPDAQAVVRMLMKQVAERKAEVAELKARRNRPSSNSSLPPSATHSHAKPSKPSLRKAKRGGGQPGHAKHERALIPVEECQEVMACIPDECRKCGRELAGVDPEPRRHQVGEWPEIKPIVTEYQRHRLLCVCGGSTCGELPAGVPTGQARPRLIAFSGLLMACFRQSKRRAAQLLSTILNQPASAAWMVLLPNRCVDAVEPADDELAAKLPDQAVWSIDESPTKEGTANGWVWTISWLPRSRFSPAAPAAPARCSSSCSAKRTSA